MPTGPSSSKASKSGRPKRGRPRRSVVRLERPPMRERVARALQSPNLGWGVTYAFVFVIVCSALAIWTRSQPLLAVGRVMDETRTVRAEVSTVDEATTENMRARARQETPRVYAVEEAVIEELVNSLATLPRALEGVKKLDEVADPIKSQFSLSTQALKALAIEARRIDQWESRVADLREELLGKPLLDPAVYQEAMTSASERIELRAGPEKIPSVKRNLVNLDDDEQIAEAMYGMARRAGIKDPLNSVVVSRVLNSPKATFRYDGAATAEAQQAAVEAIETQYQRYHPGAIIFDRGKPLTVSQHELAITEAAEYRAQANAWSMLSQRLGIAGSVVAFTIGVFAYVVAFGLRIRQNPTRMLGLAALLTGTLAVSCIGAVLDPALLLVFATLPVVLASAVLVIAYDRQKALAIGGMLALLIAFVLDVGLGSLATAIAGLGAVAWCLSDIRDRRGILEMAFWTAIALGFTQLGTGLGSRPITPESVGEILRDSALLGMGGLAIGALVLFVLPLIERAFDITTGMTLIELRDPKQPLLRQLQQRAPGTYNHSLNVASIAETAADAIGADPLLTYVGGIYHDVGKMNKPEYFIENQSGGPSKHDKLDPAMSLLVIVGHVKDGIEIARENGLPRQLMHFIEGHHGTTLVEYFYERARQKAADGEANGEPASEVETPDEVEYRYPGPKPRSKEVAILMLADCVESATRTLPEPTPARIEQLVGRLANKRLMDGQFDDCDLTLRELHIISNSISKSVASIHHGRIVYPSDKREERKAKTDDAQAKRA